MISVRSSLGPEARDAYCAFCGLPKVLVNSRLHRGRETAKVEWGSFQTIDVRQAGAFGGCNFCKLVMDVQRTWKQDDPVDEVRARLLIKDSGCELEVAMLLGRREPGAFDHHEFVVVFTEEGQHFPAQGDTHV